MVPQVRSRVGGIGRHTQSKWLTIEKPIFPNIEASAYIPISLSFIIFHHRHRPQWWRPNPRAPKKGLQWWTASSRYMRRRCTNTGDWSVMAGSWWTESHGMFGMTFVINFGDSSKPSPETDTVEGIQYWSLFLDWIWGTSESFFWRCYSCYSECYSFFYLEEPGMKKLDDGLGGFKFPRIFHWFWGNEHLFNGLV